MLIHRLAVLTLAVIAVAVGTGCQTDTPVHVLRERGDFQFEQNRYAEAADNYRQIVERYPGDWKAQYKLGLSLLETGDLVEARNALEVAYTRQPNDLDVVDALAEVMYRQRDDAYLFAFLRQRAERTQSVRSYLRLAEYSRALGDPDSAVVAVDTAIEIDDGQSVDPYIAAAELAMELQDDALALRRLRQAYGIDPRNERVNELIRELGEVPGPTLVLPPGR
jgi:Flp pilus assembly protein TadD